MGLNISGNPAGARLHYSSSLEGSIRRGNFWDEEVVSGMMLRFVDIVIDNPGWIKVGQAGINISCLTEGNFSGSFYRLGDADARQPSLRLFSLKDYRYQTISFDGPTRYRLVQLAVDPGWLSGIAGDLGEEPDRLLQNINLSCHANRRFAVFSNPLASIMYRSTEQLLMRGQTGFLTRMRYYSRAIDILDYTLETIYRSGKSWADNREQLEPIERAALLLKEEFQSPPTMPEIAGQVGLSVDGLQRAFRARYNRTPSRFLGEIRMNEAHRLLTAGDVPVSSVASLVGFTSHAAFSRAFLRHFGVPPSARLGQAAAPSQASLRQTETG
jgi:AraC-like DNA-binding protein